MFRNPPPPPLFLSAAVIFDRPFQFSAIRTAPEDKEGAAFGASRQVPLFDRINIQYMAAWWTQASSCIYLSFELQSSSK